MLSRRTHPHHAQGNSPGESDPLRKGDGTSHVTRATDRPPAQSKAESRPGRLEFLLLALVAVGVAITIAMAVIDPAA
jgi:hypothetical protein